MPDPTPFKDYFSGQAADYERHRPGYPPALFEYLAAAAPDMGRAVDVGTGNGQSAVGLAAYFAQVLATDASRAQLERARPHPRITYRCEPAEHIGAEAASVDLVVAAQAAHWFDWQRFPPEVRRVLKPGGVVAIWTYELFSVDADVDTLLADFYRNVTGPYWPRERRHVEEGYASLPFPFEEWPAPRFSLQTRWRVDEALGYLGTWSSVARYRRMRGRDPLALVAPLLRQAWGLEGRLLRWPIHLRVGRKPVAAGTVAGERSP
jgi:SAM-dependent methyltransferase